MEQIITCINCPVGCRLKVTVEEGQVTEVSGQSCKRGIDYAKQECLAPTRMVTAVVPVAGRSMPLSVKTASPIPKDKIFDCMRVLESLHPQLPVRMGQVVCADVCGTGIDVIATKNLE